MWWKKIVQIWKTKDLRKKIGFVLAMLVIFRFAAHIPIPGVELEALRSFFQRNQVFGLLNIFSGGTLENFSIVALGVGPYITASIIMQLLTIVVPKLDEISKEGEQGRQRINQWTRLLTVPLAFLQSFGLLMLLQRQAPDVFLHFTPSTFVTTMITMTSGAIFLMWIGELISEKKVGNGISLLIFAGIVSRLPGVIQRSYALYIDDPALFVSKILPFLLIAFIITAGVVFVTEAQRNIPVSYARMVRGMRSYGGVSTHLPIRVNQAGMIPIIFAISILLFPPLIAQFFITAKSEWVSRTANTVIYLFQNNLVFYGITYFLLVFGFTYFYTSIIFKPDQIAENLQKQGGFIPGVRPGKNTEEYLKNVSQRIMLAGAVFLGLVAVSPIVVSQLVGTQNLTIGGSSLIIVVSVVIETARQIDAQLSMREYEGI